MEIESCVLFLGFHQEKGGDQEVVVSWKTMEEEEGYHPRDRKEGGVDSDLPNAVSQDGDDSTESILDNIHPWGSWSCIPAVDCHVEFHVMVDRTHSDTWEAAVVRDHVVTQLDMHHSEEIFDNDKASRRTNDCSTKAGVATVSKMKVGAFVPNHVQEIVFQALEVTPLQQTTPRTEHLPFLAQYPRLNPVDHSRPFDPWSDALVLVVVGVKIFRSVHFMRRVCKLVSWR